jgi:hypothetical protein
MVDDLQHTDTHLPQVEAASTGNQAAFLAIVSSRNFPIRFCMHSFLQLEQIRDTIIRKEKF